MILIADISALQGVVDFVAMKAGGYEGVIVKVTEGLHYLDARAHGYLEAAAAAGLVTGQYAFARVSQGEPERQVDALWNRGPAKLPAMRWVLDLESAPAGMSPAQIVAFGARWVRHALTYRPLLRPIIYTYPSFFDPLIGVVDNADEAELAACDLWIAHYLWRKPGLPPAGLKPWLPRPYTRFRMWQINGGGTPETNGPPVPGVGVPCDRNVFLGTREELLAWNGLTGPRGGEADAPIVHAFPDVAPRKIDSD